MAMAQHSSGHGTSKGGAAAQHGSPHAAQHMTPSESDSPSVRAFKEAHMKMMKEMDVQLTGNADVDFANAMIPHHQGAIDMARVQLAHGKDPEIRVLAERVIAEQEKEIAQMRGWLKKNAK